MRIITNKNALFQFIFILCIAVPYLNNYELTFSVWLLATLISIRKTYSKTILIQITLFCLILILAIITSFNNDYKFYNIIRDFTYLVKPIFGLLIGYQICKTYLKNPMQTVIYAGVFIASLHILIVCYCFLKIGIRDVSGLRYYAGYFSDFEVYALIILIFSKEFLVNISTKNKIIFIILMGISSLFYLSRTNFIQFAILFLALKGYFVINKRSIIILTTFFITVIGFYAIILLINPKRNGHGTEAFLYKIKIAPFEPFKTKVNKEDYKDFNDNYRSVENILTIKESINLEWYNIFFGQGLGSTVDLQTKVYLDDVLFRYISILHNGFMTVYLKSGILGVLMLIFSILVLLKFKNNQKELVQVKYLLVGTSIFLVLSYWVFMGFYFKADTKSILVGLFIAYVEKYKIQNTTNTSEINSI